MANIKVTLQKFKAIKILLNSGATYAEVSESMGVSDFVIRHVKYSETFEEYKQKMATSSSAYRKKLAKQLKEKQEKEEQERVAAEAQEAEKKESKEPTNQVVEHQQSITIQATHYMTVELREIKELLKGMSNKLAFIVDELTK